MTRLLACCAAAALTLGCATTDKSTSSSDDVEVTYGKDADENLARGREALEAKNFPEAQRYFEFVKTKYPFLEAAATAELLLADTDFDREQFAEARERYQSFARLHPTHAKLPYAAFRAALTHHKEMPSTFFLLPPGAEKDQASVLAAQAALRTYLRDHPTAPEAKEAAQVLAEVRKRLAEHELYVADFYRREGRWPAVAGRLTTVLTQYADLGYDERAAFGLYEAYLQLGQPEKAREALRAFAERFPEASAAPRARALAGAPVAKAPSGADAGAP